MTETRAQHIHVELVLPNSSPDRFEFNSVAEIEAWVDRQTSSIGNISPEFFGSGEVWTSHDNNLKNVKDSIRFLSKFPTTTEEAGAAGIAAKRQSALRQLNRALDPYRQGSLITSFHDNFHLAAYFAEREDYESAASIIQSSMENGFASGEGANRTVNIEKALRAVVSLHAAHLKSEHPITQWRTQLSELHQDYSEKAFDLGRSVEAHAQVIQGHDSVATEHQNSRVEEWKQLVSDTRKEWSGMKAVYDEQLALLAPTDYWATRSRNHFWTSIGFAAVFAVAVGVSLSLFVSHAIPYLAGIQLKPEPATFVSALPVLVPAFAVVWILRILARQLLENLTLMQDARERETMVKTFLAFMRDQASGKAVVTDQDRAVILHSLFRPSTITATDDSPPLSILERISGKK